MSCPPVQHISLPPSMSLPSGKTLVMGILNVTPDSFSDGGLWCDTGRAREHANHMVELGAHIIDVGGESTRPGATRVTADEEWNRISPVLDALVQAGIVVSVDTVHAQTAERAIEAGVAIINDVSGGRIDPAMNSVIARHNVAYVVQHYRALPGQPGEHFDYGDDLVATLIERIRTQVSDAIEAGVDPSRIIIDPGLGFSLLPEQCWTILDEIERFYELRMPVLVGASRKRFLATKGDNKDELTAEISADLAERGVWAVRVHDVALNVAAMRNPRQRV